MVSLKDLLAKVQREMQRTHGRAGVNAEGETRRETLQKRFGRILCPDCQGHRINEDCTCKGVSFVCPGCRGARLVAKVIAIKHERVDDNGEVFDELEEKTTEYIPCPLCQPNGVYDPGREMDAIRNYLADGSRAEQWHGFGGRKPLPMAPRVEQRGFWRDQQEPEAPAEPKRGWLKYSQTQEPAVIVPGDSELEDVDAIPF